MFSHPDYDGHEALLFAQDTASGLRALIEVAQRRFACAPRELHEAA